MTVHDCSVASGTRLGPYEVVSFIAAGGMGEVYEARDTRLNRRVAIKVLPAAYGTDRDRLARFEKEARSASQLAHPNIISVYDVGEQAELPYIVTELLEGRTLATALHERPLVLDEVMDIAIQVARGLAAAHEKRIVHRDLKPANIFITTGGHVKILDFGLAKLTEEEWQAAATTDETRSLISRPGVIVGSAAYMSPEQVQGAAADLRSDIFSFGSILYEMVTGRRAFKGESPIETMSAILRDEPPPMSATECAPELVALVNRCLAKRPDARFGSASELLFALQQIAIMGPAGMVRSASAAPRAMKRTAARRLLSAVGVVALLTLFVSGVPRSRAGGNIDDGTSLRISRIERVTGDGQINDALISPDGVFLAYTTLRQNAMTPRLRHIGSGSDIELLPPREDRYLTTAGFSPDGNYVYLRQFALAGMAHRGSPLWDPLALVRVPLLGGTPEPVLSGSFSKLQFAPDGTRVAFVRQEKDGSRSRVVVADPYLKSERVVAELGRGANFTGDPAWSADSHRVLVGVVDERLNNDQPMEIDVDTRASRRLPLCAQIELATRIRSAPGGGWIVQNGLGDGQLWHVSPDGSRCRQLTDDTSTWQLAGGTSDGSTVVAIGTQVVQNLWRASIGDKEPPTRITQGINTADGDGGLAVFADGRLVFTRNTSGKIGGKSHVWILDRSGNMRQLTHGETDESHLAASPDGHTIVYTAAEYDAKNKAHWRLWTLDVDSGETRQLAFDKPARNSSFSPDGASIYYTEYPNDSFPGRLKRVPVKGGSPEDITPHTSCDYIRVSPDAKMLSCLEKGTLSIVSMADGSVVRSFVLPRRSMYMRWLPDSSAVAYLQGIGVDVGVIWALAVGGGEPRRIAQLTGEIIEKNYAFLPDGQGFVCSRITVVSDAFLLRLESAPSAK